ncbi:DUF7266 family protein [Halapricum hydrolyticum]|uniref:Secreted glycoprotein n=1 Tax=Halapricum hydrolyticum TaxID=2979991 RepID=A0AAE3I8P8_9EURY|nr:hypothetical protein [Halapricum hydrolyticum]MCU4716614.1 hypothetical protein [Halapricum hydrolyticum]MCU4725781.1 hypothetical protein [Halapricum hydrolyticum]
MRDDRAGTMRDDRAVSTTVNYVLGLSIAFLLIAGLFLAGGDFVQDQRETSVETELRVIGEQFAADMESADRLAQTTENGTVVVERSAPSRVSGTGYTVAIEGGDDPRLVLTAHDPDVEVTAQFSNRTAVQPTRISGGSIQVTETGGQLVLERRDQ